MVQSTLMKWGAMMDERMLVVDGQGIELAERGIALARVSSIPQDDRGELADVVWCYQRSRVNRGLDPLPEGRAVVIARKRVQHADASRRCDTGGKTFDWGSLSYRASLSQDDVQEARERLGTKLADLLLAGFTQAEAGAALGMSARTIKRRFAAARNGGRNNDCLDTAERMIGYGHDTLEAPRPLFVAVKNQSPMPPSHSSPMSKPITVEPITHRHGLTPESGTPCPAFCRWASANQYPLSIGL